MSDAPSECSSANASPSPCQAHDVETAGNTFKEAMGRAPENAPVVDTEAWIVKQGADNRKCGCGAVHSDYCVNCGRWSDLPLDQHATMIDGYDEPCTAGKVPHEHTDAEKEARIDRYIARARA